MVDYGMFTEYGNRVIDGVVIAAKQIGWTPTEVIELIDEISTVRGLHEAGDTEVLLRVYAAVFQEAV